MRHLVRCLDVVRCLIRNVKGGTGYSRLAYLVDLSRWYLSSTKMTTAINLVDRWRD
jgi:hypothetical protein